MSYRALALAAIPSLALAFAPSAQAVGPEALDAVVLTQGTVSEIVGTPLAASRTFDAPTVGYSVSEPACMTFAEVGLDETFNGNPGTLVAYRAQSSQKSVSDTTYYVKQSVGVFNSSMAAVDPIVALLFSDCNGHQIDVTDEYGLTETWTITDGGSEGKARNWSLTSANTGQVCNVDMRAKQEVMFQVKVCAPSGGARAASRLADAMEGGV